VALIHPAHEKQVGAKHVESLWLPRLDAGSTPASSTEFFKVLNIWVLFLKNVCFWLLLKFTDKFQTKWPGKKFVFYQSLMIAKGT
jgi:hypothetical protein